MSNFNQGERNMDNEQMIEAFRVGEDVSTAELDLLVKRLKEARMEYDQAKAISAEKSGKVDDLERELIALLDRAGKTLYEAEGVGRVTLVSKLAVTTPKDLADKEALFNWLESSFGKEGQLAYLTINYQTLNSLYNQQVKEAAERGESFQMPGIGLPTSTTTLQFRSR